MTIAEKLTRAKADLDAAYLTDTYYLPGSLNFNLMFYKTVFPDGYSLTLKIATAPATLAQVFRIATGLEKLTLEVPTDTAYPASYFAMGSTSGTSILKEITLPSGIKFSDFTKFAQYCGLLQRVNGEIDLSQSTANTDCFLGCPSLEEIRFVPGTITKSLNFNRSAELSDASIASIVLGLADLAGQDTQTLTVHSTVYDKIIALRDEHETGAGNNPYDLSAKNWTLVS